jgi:hypothetical protein
MSSLFRKRLYATALLAGAAGTLCCVGPVVAQQVTFVPQAEVTGEWASNRILTDPPTSASDEALKFGGDLKRVTPVSDLELRPILTVQDGSIKNLDTFEALVDLNGDYHTLKGEYTFNGEYHREDAYNAQYSTAQFNPQNPNVPDTSGTGALVTGITKSSYHIEPGFAYKFTQRWSVEGSASLDAVRYSTDIPDLFVSFDAPLIGADVVYATSQNSQFGIGPYYTHYEPINNDVDSVESTGYGVSANYRLKSSRLDTTTITVRVEHDSSPLPMGGGRSGATNWGIEWVGIRTFQTGQLRYSIGRFLEPSSIGGRTAEDQLRVQYNRRLTERFSANGAVRFVRNQDFGVFDAIDQAGPRDRGNVDLSLRYLVTPEWFVSGGYRFVYQHLTDSTAVNSNGVFITVGYHGREPPSN